MTACYSIDRASSYLAVSIGAVIGAGEEELGPALEPIQLTVGPEPANRRGAQS